MQVHVQQPSACYKECEVFAATLLFTGIAHEVGRGVQDGAGLDMQDLTAYAGLKFGAGRGYCICTRRSTWQQL